MDYSATVWDPYLQKDIDRIEGVQRRAARFIFNDYMNDLVAIPTDITLTTDQAEIRITDR
jgi:hypothetical protein